MKDPVFSALYKAHERLQQTLPESKIVEIPLELDDVVVKWLKAESKEHGVSESAVVCACLSIFVETHKKKSLPSRKIGP